METFTERFDEMLDFIGLTPYKLAKELDTSSSVISTIRAGKNKPGFDFLSKLVGKYENIDLNYLVTGKGKLSKLEVAKIGKSPLLMEDNSAIYEYNKVKAPPLSRQFVSQNVSPTVSPPKKKGGKTYHIPPSTESNYNLGAPRVIVVNERQEENIVYVPVKARAGYLSGYGDTEFIQSLPTLRIPGLTNATYRMFEVEGPSMAPNIVAGDRVIGQWVNSLDEIRENRVHIVVCKDGIVIKRLLNRIPQRGKIVFKSDTIPHHKDFPPIDVDPADILEIWYCVLKLTSNFSEPADINHRLTNLEAELTNLRAENKQNSAAITSLWNHLNTIKK